MIARPAAPSGGTDSIDHTCMVRAVRNHTPIDLHDMGHDEVDRDPTGLEKLKMSDQPRKKRSETDVWTKATL